MAPTAHIDFETRSAANLKTVGVYRYAEDPTTEVLCMSWRLGDGPVQRWAPGDPYPSLLDAIREGAIVAAHNAGFERCIWNTVLVRRGGLPWPLLEPSTQDCTMARAHALALPGALDNLGAALKSPVQKDKEGSRLMMQMCKPRSVSETGVITWWDDPDRRHRLEAYCDQDVLTECAVDQMIPPLTDFEQRLWTLDQRINDRGIAVDLVLARGAMDAAAEAKKRADQEMWRLTQGAVAKCSEAAKLIAWLNARGIPCVSVAKGEIEELVLSADVLGDPDAAAAIRLRRASARTSTDKFKKMLVCVCADGRLHGMFTYHKASTGRWAGSLVQVQNLVRVDAESEGPDVARTVHILKTARSGKEAVDAISLMCGPAVEWISKSVRSALVAAPGRRFVGGDWSNIEGRVNAWTANETWKLDAFRAYDVGTGHDLYNLSYARSFGIRPDDVKKPQRQIGKVQELALGYQGGVGAFINLAANYLMDMKAVSRTALDASDDMARFEAAMKWDRAGDRRYGLDKDVWVGIQIVVDAFRAANPNIVQSWWDRQDAAIDAVANPGLVVPCCGGKIQYLVAKGFLFCRLPSGRVISYCAPRIRWADTGRVDADGKRIKKRQVEYDGTHSKTKKWGPLRLYGGHQCENDTQGIARDILAEGMFRCEAWPAPLVLHAHDEMLAEVDEDSPFRAHHMEALMVIRPDWADAKLPLAAKAWEDHCYVK